MDFVQWCGIFLGELLKHQESPDNPYHTEVHFDFFERSLSENREPNHLVETAIIQALSNLKNDGLLEQHPRMDKILKVPRQYREVAVDQTKLWRTICAQTFTDDEARLLRKLNRESERRASNFAYLEKVPYSVLAAALDLASSYETEQRVEQLVRSLETLGYAKYSREINSSDLSAHATYRGLVWEHRRRYTEDSAEIDDLVNEGETSTVDLKRQLSVSTKSEKAELIKDVVALANTKATGRRYLIIGFTKDGDYYEPESAAELNERDRLLNALSEEQLQTIVAEYTTPAIRITYTPVEYRLGPIGKLEVLRDRTHVPYAVRKSIGSSDTKDKGAKRVTEGQVFLRDQTVTREARPEEIDQMKAEADRARRKSD